MLQNAIFCKFTDIQVPNLLLGLTEAVDFRRMDKYLRVFRIYTMIFHDYSKYFKEVHEMPDSSKALEHFYEENLAIESSYWYLGR